MKKYSHLTLCIAVAVCVFLFPQNIRETEVTASVVLPAEKQDSRKESFKKARKMLLRAGVPFDPDLLLLPNWRQRVKPELPQMTEMHSTLRSGDKLEGVQIADTLILPKKIELTGDVVILANTIVYEHYHTEIVGKGKSIYVFPVNESFHLDRPFAEAMRERGYADNALPAVNQRTYEKFPLSGKYNSQVRIDVSGVDYDEEYRKKREERTKRGPDPKNKKGVGLTDCPPQTEDCHGEDNTGNGATGTEGTHSGNIPPPPYEGWHGRCSLNPNGLSGMAGANGNQGGDNAGTGGVGPTGGQGGRIEYSIPDNSNEFYTFRSNGGRGGKGGTGGLGAPGDNAQEGGWGGNGADCPCNQGGAGDGADGTDGGKGGQGGRGGDGGPGGRGGDAGDILVDYPNAYDERRISRHFEGGLPGFGGDSGFGGNSGRSGDGGTPGRALGNFSCSSTEGRHGRPGNTQFPIGPSERGSGGPAGTETGSNGDYRPIRRPSPGGGGGCLRGGFTILGERSFKKGDSANLCSPCDPSPWEIQDCTNNNGFYNWQACVCDLDTSPIVVDISGNGFDLTSAQNGVLFDISGRGSAEQMSWTSSGSDDAWLALDRNGNHLIENGSELFGNFTDQPVPPEGERRNGFLALAAFDRSSNGGNSDGDIDFRDTVFGRLRLWQDTNHNGVSEPQELKTLDELGLARLELRYHSSRRTDQYGNLFGFRAKVWDTRGTQLGRWAWDVYLVRASVESISRPASLFMSTERSFNFLSAASGARQTRSCGQ
ncbi:MAG: hypothetical protein WBD22_09530 [Pyrinomonadaceae bacterium]